jgi:xylulokinase
VPVASLTVTKLRWVADNEPDVAASAQGVMLPHDWITHQLRADGGEPTTDRGDASGTGYWSPADDDYRTDLLTTAFGRELSLPRVAGPTEAVGETADGIVLAPGTGDNMGAALGLNLDPGDVVVSLGTSGTVFATAQQPTADPSGIIAGFADATGQFLPLACTLNAARVIGAALRMAGAELGGLDELALSVPDTEGLVLLPFLDGERTPALPDATGLLHGLTRANATPAHLVRASVEGMLCGLSDAVDALDVAGVTPRRIVLIGGAARSRAVQQIAAGLFGIPVALPEPAEYVALGAARQAAWVLSGAEAPPEWSRDVSVVEPDSDRSDYYRGVRAAYSSVLAGAQPLLRK